LSVLSTLIDALHPLTSLDFRGHWCPFCMAYLKTLQSLTPSITAAGGQPLIITAETAPNLTTTRTTTGYNGEAIVDPENILAKYFKQKGLLDVAISEKKGYEHGMAQPAILVIKNDGTVLENWAIVPSMVCFIYLSGR
jgi:peroxiredoxin